MNEEWLEVLGNRARMYELLSRIYSIEVDPTFWESLKGVTFPEETGDAVLDDGYGRFGAFLKNPGEGDPIENLAVDYARVFLGAGINEGKVAYPFESVYTSPKHLVMQDAWEEVCRIYAKNGLGKAEGSDLHEDHLGMELNFMSRMADRSAEALKGGDREALLASLELQKDFLEKHILNWIDRLAADLAQCPCLDFYPAAMAVTTGFVRLDHGLLEEMIAEGADA